MSIWNKLLAPLKRIDSEIAEGIAEKAAVGARAALAEAPLLDDLLDGKEVVVEMRIRLKRGEGQ